MQRFTHPGAPSLLRLIIELKGSELPSNAVYLLTISERDGPTLAAELAELEDVGLIRWSEQAEQWTPTMRGLTLGLNLPAFEPGAGLGDAQAECA